jgi:hypothetical protein
MMIAAVGLLGFYELVTLALGIKDGLQEHWVQMTLSFSMCALGTFVGMMVIFAVRFDACLRALENRLSANPLPYRKKGFSAGSALWVLISVGVLILFWLALIAASRGDFLKFGLGLLGCAITSIVFMCASWTVGFAKRIRRFEAVISAREATGNSGANAGK